MNARQIMNSPVVAATKTTVARDVAVQMLMAGYSGMPVTDRDGSVVGIVTELDMIRALRAGKPLDATTVAEIMTPDVITVDVNASAEKILEILDTKHVVRVPVVQDGMLVGIISRPDVLRAAMEPKLMRFG